MVRTGSRYFRMSNCKSSSLYDTGNLFLFKLSKSHIYIYLGIGERIRILVLPLLIERKFFFILKSIANNFATLETKYIPHEPGARVAQNFTGLSERWGSQIIKLK